MLPKKSRFSRVSFPRRRPASCHTLSWGSVSVFKDDEKKGAAVIVSKKTLSKAHDRNRMRRRVYAALSEAALEGEFTAVVYPRREALTASFETLVADLKKTLGQ